MIQHVVVLGAGESGRGVALLAQAEGHRVRVSDAGEVSEAARAELDAAGIAYEGGGHSVDDIDEVTVVVKSPGIPWEAEFVAFAKTRGIPVIGEMEFCARFAYGRYRRGRRIGITGSNGKTTTTLLTGHLLREAEVPVAVCGNVGTSYARCLLTPEAYDVYVIELSSYQLDDLRDFSVDIGTVLNLSPDHLDRYGGDFDAYAAAKYNLKRSLRRDSFWLQAADPLSLKHAPAAPAGVREIRMPRVFEPGYAVTTSHVYEIGGSVLAGPHNAANASFALTAAECAIATTYAGSDAGHVQHVLAKALRTFRNAPHRLELVGSAGGVDYVNDSKATNLDAVEKALASYERPIVWIVGGTDKGNDYSAIATLVEARVKAVVALGADNAKLERTYGDFPGGFRSVASMKDAISSARDLAAAGDVVLLSPACASFDLFRNYLDRGERFRAGVEALPGFTPAPPGA